MNPLYGLRIEPSIHVGDMVIPELPEALVKYRGPYRQRKQRRWRREHPARYVAAGRYYLLRGNTVVCHPDDVPILRQLLITG